MTFPSLSVSVSVSLALLCLSLSHLASRPTAAAVQHKCSARTNTTHQTIPAFIYVRNKCTSATIYTCLEYDGAFQYMRAVPPGHTTFIASQTHDCWTFRAASCAGHELYQHSLNGSRKFTIGCTIHDIDVQALGVEHDVPVSCTLTTTPSLADVNRAVQTHLASLTDSQPLADHLATSLAQLKAVQYVDRVDLLKFALTKAVDLSRHGVHLNQSLSIYEHARVLVAHMKQCSEHLVTANEYAVPAAYIAVYGVVSAVIESKTRAAGKWISNVADLTAHQKHILTQLQDLVDGNSITDRNPLFLNQNKTQELLQNNPTTTTRQLMSSSSSTSNTTAHTSSTSESEGNYYCDKKSPQYEKGDWLFYQDKKSVSLTLYQCCSRRCMSGTEVMVSGTLSGLTTTCCVICNLATRCSTSVQSPYLDAIVKKIEVLVEQNGTVITDHFSF